MGWVSGIVVFLLVWWTILFAVLPFGVRPDNGGPDTAMPGAPQNPRIGQKFLVTTIISAILWVLIYTLVESDLISFREMAKIMHEKDLQP